MSRQQYTAGPWDSSPKGRHDSLIFNDGRTAEIEWCQDMPEAERQANIRLIASAPCLHHMLQRMIDETSGGAAPCLLTLAHARTVITRVDAYKEVSQ